MEMNEEKIQQDDSCNHSSGSGGYCCSSGSGNWKSWRTVVFILVLLAAGALAAHSVLSKGINSLGGGIAAGLCPLNKPCASSSCELKATNTENAACIIKEKGNKPSSCCLNAEVPSFCPNAGTSDCCANTETPRGCPITENQGGCPKTTAASGCCPKAGSE